MQHLQSDDYATTVCKLAEKAIGEHCRFLLDAETKFFFGGEYFVYPFESTASRTRLCVRIPRNSASPYASVLLQREADIRRRIEAAQIELVQPVIAVHPTADNPLHTPFLVLGWADGSPLDWSDVLPSDEGVRQHVLRSIANTSLELLRVCDDTGKSALEWIMFKINRKISRAESDQLPGGTVAECHQQKQLIQDYWISDLDLAPYVLVHGDLSSNNVIIDEHQNILSIIDFGWAELLPLQFAAVFPRFLTHEPSINQGYEWKRRRTKQMEQDRKFYLEVIRARAIRNGGIFRDYYRVLSRHDEPTRYWWFTAASRIDIHRAMASCDWAPPINT